MKYYSGKITKVVLLMALSAAITGCSTVTFNKAYDRNNLPLRYQVKCGYIGVVISDIGQARRCSDHDTGIIVNSIRKGLEHNHSEFSFFFPHSAGWMNEMNISAQPEKINALNDLFDDARKNVKTGFPSKEILDSPHLKDILRPSNRHILLYTYTGVSKTERLRKMNMAGAIMSVFSSGPVPDPDDSSYFSFLLMDTAEKKYICYYRSYNSGYAQDPRTETIVNTHLESFLKTLKFIKTGEMESAGSTRDNDDRYR